jgi:hypothetical protein
MPRKVVRNTGKFKCKKILQSKKVYTLFNFFFFFQLQYLLQFKEEDWINLHTKKLCLNSRNCTKKGNVYNATLLKVMAVK